MKQAALVLVLVLSFCQITTGQPQSRPDESAKRRVMIVSIDGLRPDILLRADTPNMHEMMQQGCFSFWAMTTAQCDTLPSHTSMVTGVTPRKHEVEWNIDLPLEHPVYPKYPTLMELAKRGGYTTAMICGKSKFIALAKPGTLDWQFIPGQTQVEDPQVAEKAVQVIREHQPQVLFVHFPSTDNVGHAIGWATPQQLATVHQVDALLGQLLAALAEVHLRDQTLIIITADHGGYGRMHEPDDARARYIPWIVVGPDVKHGLDLTTYAELHVRTEDTFATACYYLKIPVPLQIDGKPVKEIFEPASELLQGAARN